MKLAQLYKQYLLFALFPLIALLIYGNKNNILIGYLIGMILALIQISFAFIKGNSIVDTYGNSPSNKMIFIKSMFGPLLLIFVSFIGVYKLWGLYAFLGCAIATLLQRPVLFIVAKKQNKKGGVN